MDITTSICQLRTYLRHVYYLKCIMNHLKTAEVCRSRSRSRYFLVDSDSGVEVDSNEMTIDSAALLTSVPFRMQALFWASEVPQ